MNVYEEMIAGSVNNIAGRDIYFSVPEIMALPDETASEIIGKLVFWACNPTNIMPITIGRDRLKQFPEEWVSARIMQKAADHIDITDDWDYRRLLELCQLISPGLLKWAIGLNEGSSDPDIIEAVEDFKERAQNSSGQ